MNETNNHGMLACGETLERSSGVGEPEQRAVRQQKLLNRWRAHRRTKGLIERHSWDHGADGYGSKQ